MAKSKPVGIRYDLDLFDVATKEDGVTTPQQFHSLLEAIYIAHKNSLKKVPNVSTVGEKPVAKTVDQPIKKETILISKDKIFDLAQKNMVGLLDEVGQWGEINGPKDFTAWVAMAKEGVKDVEAFKLLVSNSNLNGNQKAMVLSKIKSQA